MFVCLVCFGLFLSLFVCLFGLVWFVCILCLLRLRLLLFCLDSWFPLFVPTRTPGNVGDLCKVRPCEGGGERNNGVAPTKKKTRGESPRGWTEKKGGNKDLKKHEIHQVVYKFEYLYIYISIYRGFNYSFLFEYYFVGDFF